MGYNVLMVPLIWVGHLMLGAAMHTESQPKVVNNGGSQLLLGINRWPGLSCYTKNENALWLSGALGTHSCKSFFSKNKQQ